MDLTSSKLRRKTILHQTRKVITIHHWCSIIRLNACCCGSNATNINVRHLVCLLVWAKS